MPKKINKKKTEIFLKNLLHFSEKRDIISLTIYEVKMCLTKHIFIIFRKTQKKDIVYESKEKHGSDRMGAAHARG